MIYVDALKQYRRQSYCHMISDTSRQELHDFATKIGVARHWFHKTHYDLRERERELAVANGAKEVSSRDIVKILRTCGADG